MKYIATILLLVFAASGCSKEASSTDDVGVTDVRPVADAGDTADAALSDASPDATPPTPDAELPDAEPPFDATSDASSNADAGEDTDSSGPSLFDAQVTVDGASLPFDRAFYGRTDGALTNSGFNEYHVEIHRGGVADCPEQDSPSPNQTVIVTNIVIPTSVGETQTEADGLVVSFLDFFGELTDEVLMTAIEEKITWVALDQDALVFEIDAPLDGGAISGTVVATRCASLDI